MKWILTTTESVKLIEYQNLKIVWIDFPSNSNLEEIKKTIAEAKSLIASQPKNSVYTLTTLGEFLINTEIGREFREFTAHNKPYVKAAAVTGVYGIRQAILNSLKLITKRNMLAANSREEALNYHWKESLK